jgi:hypothetical protein
MSLDFNFNPNAPSLTNNDGNQSSRKRKAEPRSYCDNAGNQSSRKHKAEPRSYYDNAEAQSSDDNVEELFTLFNRPIQTEYTKDMRLWKKLDPNFDCNKSLLEILGISLFYNDNFYFTIEKYWNSIEIKDNKLVIKLQGCFYTLSCKVMYFRVSLLENTYRVFLVNEKNVPLFSYLASEKKNEYSDALIEMHGKLVKYFEETI